MDFHMDYPALAAALAVRWLPVFLVAATVHWFLLAGRRWRAAGLAAALALEIGLALAVVFTPMFDPSLRFKMILAFDAIGGLTLAAAFFSALLATLLLLVCMRFGSRPDSSSGPQPLGGPV